MVIALFAFLSAASRGLISVIDRYQIGINKENMIVVNLKNNLYTLILATVGIIPFISLSDFGELLNWRILIYSLLVQFVALGYSALFKKLTILESLFAGKFSDIFIPLALFATTGYFKWNSYTVSLVTTALIFYLVMSNFKKEVWQGVLLITPILVLQSALSPLLTIGFKTNFKDLLVFTYLTLIYRFLIVLVLIFVSNKNKFTFSKGKFNYLYILRSFLTIIAQVFFTVVTSSKTSGIAWIFLNITSLYGVVFSAIFLKEKIQQKEIVVLILITIITIVSSLWS